MIIHGNKQFRLLRLQSYLEWFNRLSLRDQQLVNDRLSRIEKYGHLGDYKKIDDKLFELRWRNGWRVYFVFSDENEITLLIGGDKNGQKKDINKAKSYLR